MMQNLEASSLNHEAQSSINLNCKSRFKINKSKVCCTITD